MRTSSWNVCTRPASPLLLPPNDPPGVQALSPFPRPRRGDEVEGEGGEGGGGDDAAAISGQQEQEQTSNDLPAATNTVHIPWTIANKYYTADVHFEAREFEHFRVHHAVGVPAIIYVWGPGEVRLSPFQAPPHWRLISCLADICVSNLSARQYDVG